MKKLTTILFLASMLALPSLRAADKEETITGEGQCAKCSLKMTDQCQNAIKVEKDGKSMVYLLAPNDVSKKFHKNICSDKAKITAHGTVKKEGDKMILTPTKIEMAKG